MSDACQVDFYLLGSPQLDEQRLACKLAMMAWERGHRICVVTSDAGAANALDKLMWQYPEGRFLPHEQSSSGPAVASPVNIIDTAPEGAQDVVINLTTAALTGQAQWQRLLEIVPFRDEDREASRNKFKAYRAAGLAPRAHNIN
jgi:DNA polymerase-3 subunit chi